MFVFHVAALLTFLTLVASLRILLFSATCRPRQAIFPTPLGFRCYPNFRDTNLNLGHDLALKVSKVVRTLITNVNADLSAGTRDQRGVLKLYKRTHVGDAVLKLHYETCPTTESRFWGLRLERKGGRVVHIYWLEGQAAYQIWTFPSPVAGDGLFEGTKRRDFHGNVDSFELSEPFFEAFRFGYVKAPSEDGVVTLTTAPFNFCGGMVVNFTLVVLTPSLKGPGLQKQCCAVRLALIRRVDADINHHACANKVLRRVKQIEKEPLVKVLRLHSNGGVYGALPKAFTDVLQHVQNQATENRVRTPEEQL